MTSVIQFLAMLMILGLTMEAHHHCMMLQVSTYQNILSNEQTEELQSAVSRQHGDDLMPSLEEST